VLYPENARKEDSKRPPKKGDEGVLKKRRRSLPCLFAFCDKCDDHPVGCGVTLWEGSRTIGNDAPVEIIKERKEIEYEPAKAFCLVAG